MFNQEIINEVKDRLVKTYTPFKIYLFGSYAWGSPTEDSDLDLLVVVDESNQKSFQRAIQGHRALFGLHVFKDLLVLTKKEFEQAAEHPSSLCFKIKKHGKVLYVRS
ncbi:MAG: Nucleotidyltransferase domain protein [candidate division TM6 bacterium GW2011_GWF2_43_87]|nr:MAG: Nucleotidyltransferase domain protein [candidate division TM6 bacterium GW2011_GWF2_43_87]